MGTDISGWVEAHYERMEPNDSWVALLDAGHLLDRNYDAFHLLFGVRPRTEEEIQPIASYRGIPADLSEILRKEVLDSVENSPDERYKDGRLFCHSASYITWEEMQTVNWSALGASYARLFRLCQILAETSHFDDLRLVVWFRD